MAINKIYFDYLKHFEKTYTLNNFRKLNKPAIGLRHDIDHCIDTALEMAYWEAENSIRSTYFVLDTADYFKDPSLIKKCLQIQDFGHEVGIHTNFITKWVLDRRNPYEDLNKTLEFFRKENINIYGTSAHGDKACYDYNFINYWLFSDLKPEIPHERENNLNAEGSLESNKKKRIKYPENHIIDLKNGHSLELWKVSQAELKLEYEASHLKFDEYYTDSGGAWTRSGDPLTKDLKNKKIQILIHPIHWKAPQKIFFFLSTARSGSKWLATLMNKASSCNTKHEYTLNNFDDNKKSEIFKMTRDNLDEIINNQSLVNSSFKHLRNEISKSNKDYAEANVYLTILLNNLKQNFPEATFIHLHRNPSDVVRSILNRGWYDTKNDLKHPRLSITNWNELTQFEKCCVYVSEQNKELLNNTNNRICLEEIASDIKYFKNEMKKLDIAFYPLLAEELFQKKTNINTLNNFPKIDQWSSSDKITYKKYLFKIEKRLGYNEISLTKFDLILNFVLKKFRILVKFLIFSKKITNLINMRSPSYFIKKAFVHNLDLKISNDDFSLMLKDNNFNAYILFKGGPWLKKNFNSGWKLKNNGFYNLKISSKISGDSKFNLFCLYYDSNSNLCYKRHLGAIRNGESSQLFSFAKIGNFKYFNIALHVPKGINNERLYIENIKLDFYRDLS